MIRLGLERVENGVIIMVFNAPFNNISVILWVRFIGGRNWCTWRKQSTCRKYIPVQVYIIGSLLALYMYILLVHSWHCTVYIWFTPGIARVYIWFTPGIVQVYIWLLPDIVQVYIWFTPGIVQVYICNLPQDELYHVNLYRVHLAINC
jgi:hypothetical protein